MQTSAVRLGLASSSAAIITLLLFLTMQAMIGPHDPRRVQPPSAQSVAFIDQAGLRRTKREAVDPPADLAAQRALEALPPMPELVLPQASRPPPRVPDSAASRTLASAPERPRARGDLKMPRHPRPALTPSPPSPKQSTPRTAKPSPARRPAAKAPSKRQSTPDPTRTASTVQAIGKKSVLPAEEPGAHSANDSAISGAADRGTDSEARPLVRVEPVYPRRAARAGQEGWVKLAFTITPSGKVEDVVVVAARPRRVFERSARRALAQWRFQPQLVNGRPMPRQATQVIEFTLAGRG